MRTTRGAANVLFNLLPGQTTDLAGRVWRVSRWSEARRVEVDPGALRSELFRAVYPWIAAGEDGGLGDALRAAAPIDVVAADEAGGVVVERFPANYRCSGCGTIEDQDDRPCSRCKGERWQQLPFVAYHACGYVDTPWIPRCKAHGAVAVGRLGRTADTRSLRFHCPVCQQKLSDGFPHVPCRCGKGTVKVNVHRAAAVCTPRSTVVLNPPTPEVAAQLRGPATADRVLDWVLQDMASDDPLGGKSTREALVAQFLATGVSAEMATQFADQVAAKEGHLLASDEVEFPPMVPERRQMAAEAALRVAYATAGGRVRADALANRADSAERRELFESTYPAAFAAAGLLEVELLDDFLVLDAVFGITRDDRGPGTTTLRPFRDPRGTGLRVHGELNRTEALLFRLDPGRVGRWLEANDLAFGPAGRSNAEIRGRVLANAEIPRVGEMLTTPTLGSRVLELVHSYAHRVLRRASAFCGIDRDALSEYLVPEHLCFAVFAAARGGFTLGGLQAVFEQDLDRLLVDLVGGERRCPLDPTCTKHGGACVGCLHVGEPSCRCFNQFLSRETLFGPRGYLDLHDGDTVAA